MPVDIARIARDFDAQMAAKAKMAESKQDDSEKGGLAAAPPLQQYGATEPAGKEGSLAKSDVAEQHLERAGVFGGHGCTVCAVGVFEGFICVWLTLVLVALIQTRNGFLIFFVLFGCCFHCCTQRGITTMDPGAVNATLESLEKGMDDDHTAAVFEELRKVPATVKVVAEASHTETETSGAGENQQTTTRTVIDHREDEKFSYASWKDVSGRVAGLDEYKVAAVEVVPKIECADAATTASLQSLTQRLLETCKKHVTRSGRAESHAEAELKHPKYEVGGSRVFVTRSAGEEHASWMNTSTYTACRFAWPGLGTVYRILLFTSVANVRYTITKSISVNKQQGDGWNEWQDV